MSTVYHDSVPVDLAAPSRQRLGAAQFFYGDNNSHVFTALVADTGNPEAGLRDGTVSGTALRADGVTVVLEGEKGDNFETVTFANGLQAQATPCSVTLPQAAFAVPGTLTISIKLTEDTTATTVLSITGTVVRTETDSAVDPGEILPDLAELQAAAAEALAAAGDAEEAAAEALAAANAGVRTDTAAQGLTDTQKSNARTNIAAADQAGFNDLKNSVAANSAYNLVPPVGSFEQKTSNGVTFTWNAEHTVCTLNSSAAPTGYAIDRYLFDSTSLLGLEPGKTYLFNIVPSAAGTGIDLYFYINGSLGSSVEITSPTYVTVPTNATGILSRVMAHSDAGKLTNATVRVEILTALPAADMLYAKTAAPYLAGSTLTLGSITDNGFYVIDSGWTLPDAPAELATTGGLLTVERFNVSTTNLTRQTYTATLAPNSRKIFTRIKAGGSWGAWQDMTPLTRCTLVPTGDTTDRATEITAALTRDGTCILAPGTYYVSNVVMPDDTALQGSGMGSTKIVMLSTATGSCVKLGSRCSVSDLSLYGGENSAASSDGGRNAIGWEGTYVSEETPGTHPVHGQVSNLYIDGFTGSGIICNATSMMSNSGLQVVNVSVYHCWTGINNPFVSEYCQVTNLRVTNCAQGAYINGGNNMFVNCSFTSCTLGLFMFDDSGAAPNNSHGSFVGCCFNHANNNSGVAISLYGLDSGEVFSGCQIFYGKIRVTYSKGIRFVGCNFGSTTALTIQNNLGYVGFDSCQFKDADASPLTASNNHGLRFNNCYLYDGTAFDPTA